MRETENYENLSVPTYTFEHLSGIAETVGRAAALGAVHRDNGNHHKSETWFADARSYSERAREITNAFPLEVKQYYRDYVQGIVDRYSNTDI